MLSCIHVVIILYYGTTNGCLSVVHVAWVSFGAPLVNQHDVFNRSYV